MNEMKKRCWSCGKFNAYFTRGFCCLMKEDNGFCREYNKVVKKTDTCDKWYCKRMSKERRIKIVLRSLPEIYDKIAALEQILTEETELQNIKDEIDTIKEDNVKND